MIADLTKHGARMNIFIFVHFPLRVYLVSVYESGHFVGRGLRSEVPDENQADFKLGIESETRHDSAIACLNADFVEETFELLGDKSKSVHTFSRIEEETANFDVKSGLKAFDINLSSKVRVSRKGKIKLTFKLPAGVDYRLKRDRKGTGIWWD